MKKHFPKRKTLLTIGGILAIAALAIFILEITNTTHLFHKKYETIPAKTTPTTQSTSPTTTVQGGNNDTTQPTPSSDKTQSANTPSGSTTNSSEGPTKPYGTFVANHHPSLNNSPNMESVCSGTPGAKCYISFTMGNSVKTLPEQVIGSDGSTIWQWNLKTAGFSEGKWSIKAISTLNGKSTEATDQLELEVQP